MLSGSKKVTNTTTSKVGKSITSKSGTLSTSGINSITSKTYNLINLKTLINQQLQHVVSANMGSGDRKDILNYRTGRFASSVNVEKLTLSKEGMITAFYSYMENPYATFSDGGKQEYPKTRDPKLLISKSIREIGAMQVANRMRAIVI
jgi:hypothetical protein